MISSDNDSAFIDIVANIFGVILLITLFIFIVRGTLSIEIIEKTQPDIKTIDFTPPKKPIFPPYSYYILFYENRYLKLDRQFIVQTLINQPQKDEFQTAYGKVQIDYGDNYGIRLLEKDFFYSDIDSYKITIFLEKSKIKAEGKLLDINKECDFVRQIKNNKGTAIPSFIVHKTGMDLFSRIYPCLINSKIRFRWQNIYSDELSFTRNAIDFIRYESKR
jgi:hypothetical protein